MQRAGGGGGGGGQPQMMRSREAPNRYLSTYNYVQLKFSKTIFSIFIVLSLD